MTCQTLSAELEVLVQAAPALLPWCTEQLGAGDTVFFADMRLALETIRPSKPSLGESKRGAANVDPASDYLPVLRENEGDPVGELRDRVTHAFPQSVCPNQATPSARPSTHRLLLRLARAARSAGRALPVKEC